MCAPCARAWGSPCPRYSKPEDPFYEHGRGLFLVDQLATEWGTLAPWKEGVYFLLTWP
ncbi:hypothetical protein NI17_010200 [Thermobifida halotolerans]|uniref:Histidine kinase/HSP90-like ATPase domain-containing protein n=1 Tax=Thermobifida halotolerans TaxID=483545 RepID=A0AA97M055_9ACTN|nr:hypothetical protein [Thermobifida halotolerans]UOE21442.1 hypothetical protein NI17_010200 [Thermobifida halotolerans]